MKTSDFFKGLGHGTLGFLSLFLGMTIPYAFVPGFLLSLYEISNARKNFLGNNVKHSMFTVTSVRKKLFGKRNKYRYIEQDVFALKQYLNAIEIDKEHKRDFFVLQASNLLQQLPKYDKNGEEYVYGTHSQPMTRFFLNRLAKSGYIKEFKTEKNGKSRLLVEKWLIGNDVNKKRKTDMFDISFKIGDIPITNEVIKDILNSNGINPDIYESEIIDGKLIFNGKLKESNKIINEESIQKEVDATTQKADEVETKEKTIEFDATIQKSNDVTNNNDENLQYTEADIAEYMALYGPKNDIQDADELNTSSRGR